MRRATGRGGLMSTTREDNVVEDEPNKPELSPANQRMLELLKEWQSTPLSPEDLREMEEMAEFLKRNRFTLRPPSRLE
jgi:hypothetical protein